MAASSQWRGIRRSERGQRWPDRKDSRRLRGLGSGKLRAFGAGDGMNRDVHGFDAAAVRVGERWSVASSLGLAGWTRLWAGPGGPLPDPGSIVETRGGRGGLHSPMSKPGRAHLTGIIPKACFRAAR